MGFCQKCGEIVKTHNGVCPCGGASQDSATSGITSKDNRGDTYSNAYLSSGLNAGVDHGLRKMMGLHPTKVNEYCIDCGRHLEKSDDVFVGPTHAGGHTYCEPCYTVHFKKGDCVTCHKPVLGLGKEYVMQDNQVWHKECFAGKACVNCSKVIFGNAVEALDQFYHPECFKCFNCQQGLVGGFMDMSGSPCCKPCYASFKQPQAPESSGSRNNISNSDLKQKTVANPAQPPAGTFGSQMGTPQPEHTCSKCKQGIFSQSIQLSTGALLHQECFTCSSCQVAISGKFILEDGNPYHPQCRVVTAKSALSCAKCHKEIQSKFIKIDESTVLHSECFTCVTCSTSLGGKAYADRGQGPTCEECLKKSPPTFIPGFTVNQAGLKELRGPGGFKLVENQALKALGGTTTCPKCSKGVFPFEKVQGPMNTLWHKGCLKCSKCSRALDSGAKMDQLNPYCTTCVL